MRRTRPPQLTPRSGTPLRWAAISSLSLALASALSQEAPFRLLGVNRRWKDEHALHATSDVGGQMIPPRCEPQLISSANRVISAVCRRRMGAMKRSPGFEVDFLASLIENGVDMLEREWKRVLAPFGIDVGVAGVFCHQSPKVAIHGTPPRRVKTLSCELADLLVLHSRRMDDLSANGFVQRLHHRRWRGSVFVGMPPEVLIIDQKNTIVCRLTGLLSLSVRLALSRSVAASGGSCEMIASNDLDILGAMEIKITNGGILSKLAREYRLSEITPGLSRDFVLPDWTAVLAEAAETPPNVAPEVWDSGQGKFRPAGIAHNRDDLRLERWLLDQAQALYRLVYGNRQWTTRSRLWAMLAYNAISGTSIGSANAQGTVVLKPELSLPPGFERRVLYYGAGVCVRNSDGSRVYPGDSRWSTARALKGWIKSAPASRASATTALSRYRQALRRIQMQRSEIR
jgi:hypothetical protein